LSRARCVRIVIVAALALVQMSDLRGAIGRHTTIDFTGDGQTDFTVVRNTGGGPTGAITWFVQRNGERLPRAVVDFTGNGMTDFALVRNTGGGPGGAITWFVENSYKQFTDDPVTATSSVIKAAHVTELRTRIDALRIREGIPAFTWTPATITAASTVAARQHMVDLRAALAPVYVGMEMAAPTYTNASLTAGVSVVKAIDLTELRNAVKAAE
jgi:hypothetical protein